MVALSLLCAGCGLAYQAGSQVKTRRIKDSLKPGESTLVVHQDYGEPDIRTDLDAHTEIWSYVQHANSNDLTATLLYTSTKPGDTGKFLDLKFVNGNLVSWNEATHTVPTKQGARIQLRIRSDRRFGTSEPLLGRVWLILTIRRGGISTI